MNKLSEIISKPVISLYDGQNEGIVGNILFDREHKKPCLQSFLTTQKSLSRRFFLYKKSIALETP